MPFNPAARLLALVLAIWCMGAVAVHAADCNAPKRPVSASESTWYCYRDSDTVIVFVHGILSDNIGSWTSTAETQAFWPELVLQDKANFGEPAIFLAAYPTGVVAGEYDIDSAAAAVLNSLTIRIEDRAKKVTDFKHIMFVAHSLGGIVSRRLVLMDPDAFKNKQIAFALVASPSLGTDFNYYFKLLSQIVRVQNNLNDQMSFKNEYVDGLDSEFRKFIRQRGPNVTGVELFEALPLGQSDTWKGIAGSFFRSVIDDAIFGKKTASRPVVSMKESYGKYWDKKDAVIPGTDHWSIAKPYSIDAPSHRALAAFFANIVKPVFESTDATCPQIEEIRIKLSVKKYRSQKWPILSFLRLPAEDDENEYEPEIPHASNGRFELPVSEALPCPGTELGGEINFAGWQGQPNNSVEVSGEDQDAAEKYNMSICFKRSTDDTRDKAVAAFDCKNPDKGRCKLNTADTRSIAELCEPRDARYPANGRIMLAQNGPLLLAMDAPQQSDAKQVKRSSYWVTPSLAAIVAQPPEKRISYTEFTVRADELPAQAADADRFGATVLVNGTPVFFDGIDPGKIRRKIASRKSISYEFGLDPLNFNGANFGYEQIEVKFNFYKGKRLLHTAYSRRPYAANRNYSDAFNPLMERLTFDNGGKFDWHGVFRPGGSGDDRFSILLQSAKPEPDLRTAIDKMEAARIGLQGLRLSFEGKPVQGRLAAPRPTNQAVGLTLVLKLESGRTLGSFSMGTAEKLCRFLMRNRDQILQAGAMTPDAVIYDHDPALYSSARDIGRFRRTCDQVTRAAKS